MSYTLDQGIVHRYTDARTCEVLHIPDHYLLTNVRLPEVLKDQSRPLIGSTVLIASEDAYKSYIIAVLREPLRFVNTDGVIRGTGIQQEAQSIPGELFFESRGNPDVPGFGATLHLGNDGTATISSGQRTELLVIGGRDSDDDHEVVLQGSNGFFQSNINDITSVRSTVNFDDLNTIQIANNLATLGTSLVEVPIAELKIDTLGNITVRNTLSGVDNAKLLLNTTGQITLQNSLGVLDINSAGIINLNNGSFGVARLNDTTLSNASADTIFWNMLTALQTFMTTAMGFTGPLSPVAAAATTFTASSTPYPTSLTSIINSASTTVKAGD